MDLDDALRIGHRTLRARPGAVLPLYVAGLATTAVARTVPFVGAIVASLLLVGTGRLDRLEAVLAEAAPIAVDDPDALVGVDTDALGRAVEDVLTPELALVVLASVALAVLVALVVDSVASAGQLHAVFAVLRGQPATRTAVAGVGVHWQTFLALVLVELLAHTLLWLVWGVLSGVGGPVVLVLGVFGLVAGSVVLRLGFAFARPAAVVDHVGVEGAIRGGFEHVRENAFESLGYGVVAVVVLVGVAVVGSGAGVLGSVASAALFVAILARPVLDATKTALYADVADVRLVPPQLPAAGWRPRLQHGLSVGLREVASFARGHPGALAVSAAVFVGGVFLGVRMGAAVDHLFVASIERRLAEVEPASALVGYATNNWSVAAAQAFAGFALGLPTVVSLAFNGANVGFLYQLETDPTLLLAFVLPHGLIELPALVLSGALGLHLGGVGLRALTGAATRRELAEEVDRAYRFAVGLAVLFLVAAVVEALVSPYYWQLLGL